MTSFDFAGLAASLAVHVRASGSRIVMDRAALLRTMLAIDDIEQSWQADLARQSRRDDPGARSQIAREMLAADVLLRTWTAFVGTSIDAGRHPLRTVNSAAMLTRMLLQQRRRVLTVIVDLGLDSPELLEIDRGRCVSERWTDVLLSVFPLTATTRALQFDSDRSREFSELWPKPLVCTTRTAEPVVVTAMKSALPAIELTASSRRPAYAQLATAIRVALEHDRRKVAQSTAATP